MVGGGSVGVEPVEPPFPVQPGDEGGGAMSTHTASPPGSAATAMLRSQSACLSMDRILEAFASARDWNTSAIFRGNR